MTADIVRVHLDGLPYEVAAHTTLADLLANLGHAPEAVGTAVNGAFVARAARTLRTLHEGDAIVLFQPIVGG